MNPAPVVSIVICLYNGRRYIAETLRSVRTQTFQDFEVIVVDDGSTDGAAEDVAREFASLRMNVVRQENGGQGAALRTGISHARGEWLAFLDQDDLWVPEKLERQLAAAAADPAVAVLFSDCLLIDDQGLPLRRVSDQFDFGAFDLTGTHGYIELLRRGCFISMSTVMARTDAVRRVGSVNAAYRYVLDYDLWLRLARHYPICYAADVLAQWRVHDGQFTQRYPEIALAEESAVLRPIFLSASSPRALRVSVGDYLFGRHRECCRALWRQGRTLQAIGAAAGMVRYPGRVADYCRDKAKGTPLGRVVERSIDRWLHAMDMLARGRAVVRWAMTVVVTRLRRSPNRIRRMLAPGR